MNFLELYQKSSEFAVFNKSTDDFTWSIDFCFHDWPRAFDDDFLQVIDLTIVMTIIIAVYYFELSATIELSTTIFYHSTKYSKCGTSLISKFSNLINCRIYVLTFIQKAVWQEFVCRSAY
jgi:hypothetical protein